MGRVLAFSLVCWWAAGDPQIPVLLVTPVSVSLVVEGQNAPPAQEVRIRNTGSGALRWTASPSAPWLRVSPRQGSGPSALMVEVDRSQLARGRHEARIVIDAGDADDSPVSVSVTVDVGEDPAPAAPRRPVVTGAEADRVHAPVPSPSAPAQSAPASNPLRLERQTLPPAARNIPYTQALPVAGGTPPYSIRIVEGRLPTGLTLAHGAISGTARRHGHYPFVIAVTDSSAPPAAIVQPLALRVIILQADTALALTPRFITTRLPGRGRDGHTKVTIASGRQPLEWSASTDVSWLRLIPASGVSPAVVDVVALGAQLAPGTHVGSITVTMEGAPNSPASIPVQVTVPR